MHSDVRPAERPGRARRMRREAPANAANRRKPPGPEATGRNRRKHCGLLVGTLGLVLMALGALLFTGTGGMMQYVLPAPGATQEGGELEALYEAGRKQMDTISDSLTGYAIGARKQGANVSVDGGQSVAVTLYAVGEGYFDVIHETLTNGRTISVTDVRSAANAIVLDESTALKLFSGDDPIGGEVKLDGLTFEVAGVIRSGRRIGEVDEHVAYVPITSVSRQAMQMQTVEVTARSTQSVASSILMEDTLAGWQKGGSFYSMDKLALGAVMPLRWMVLIVGCLVLLGLLARLNAQAWGRVCFYADQLKTRYARDMLASMALSTLLCLLGYVLLGGAAFLLARFSIEPLYVFTEWVPEVIVELSSLSARFWSLNNANAGVARYVSRWVCQMELGQGLFRWGMMAALLGVWLHGIPWLNRRIELPQMNRDR